MALEFSWQLSRTKDDLSRDKTHWQAQPGDWVQLAQAVEYAGLEGLWIDSNVDQPDSLGVAAALCAHTRQLRLTVGIAPEVMLPAALATTLQSLQSISQQRIRAYLPDSGRNSAYRAFGEFFNRDQRQERISEYIELLSRLLLPQAAPLTHTGRYFQLENAGVARRDLGAPPLILDESQGPDVSGRYADQCLISLGPLSATSRQIQRLNKAAKTHGRELSFACRLGLILGDSDQQAWQAASQYLAGLAIRPPATHPSVIELNKAFAETRRLEIHPNLWQPVANGPVFLVGTAPQLAARLETLHELGFKHVIIESSNAVSEVLRFAELVLPLLASRGLRQESAHRG